MLKETKQIKDYSVQEVIDAWKNQIDGLPEEKRKQVTHSQHLTDKLLNFLAEGQPISLQMLQERLKTDKDTSDSIFSQIGEGGGELDQDGNIVGLALSLVETPHRIKLNGKDFYAWCSLDTMFLPGLLGQSAEIESNCPVTGELIKVSINEKGLKSFEPAEAVLSIAMPGVSCSVPNAEKKAGVGANSEACSQMHFFKDRQAAEKWVQDYEGVAIFTMKEAYRLAEENWLSRRN